MSKNTTSADPNDDSTIAQFNAQQREKELTTLLIRPGGVDYRLRDTVGELVLSALGGWSVKHFAVDHMNAAADELDVIVEGVGDLESGAPLQNVLGRIATRLRAAAKFSGRLEHVNDATHNAQCAELHAMIAKLRADELERSEAAVAVENAELAKPVALVPAKAAKKAKAAR